jgi:hypothetical protein
MSMADMSKVDKIPDGADAVFLSGKIHGAEHQLYIISMNWCANDGNGSFEIEIVDAPRILQAYEESCGDAEEFFGTLPALFQGEWKYCDAPSEDFDELADAWFDADFISDRDGTLIDEMLFLVNWAKGE